MSNYGVKVGDTIPWQSLVDADSTVRVMAIADGYAMVRRKGCIPFVLYLSEWARKNPEYLEDATPGDDSLDPNDDDNED